MTIYVESTYDGYFWTTSYGDWTDKGHTNTRRGALRQAYRAWKRLASMPKLVERTCR